MDINDINPRQILEDIKAGKFGWLKIRRFDPESLKYDELIEHHRLETTRMLEIITVLCQHLVDKEMDGEHAGEYV